MALVIHHVFGNTWWIAAMGILTVFFLGSIYKIAGFRTVDTHIINRMSPFLWPGWLLFFTVVVAWKTDMFHLSLALLLASLIFSVMTGSNPLEEFKSPGAQGTGQEFGRRQPQFHFLTPVKDWIDFWARKDLVAEFGLGEVRYSRTGEMGAVTPDHPVSRRVTNLNMHAADHSAYQANIEQFIAPLTRLFLEELGFRERVPTSSTTPDTVTTESGERVSVPAYDRNITRAMSTRSRRVFWLGSASLLLGLMTLLFAPSIYRSIGEAIVFDGNFSERTSTWTANTSAQALGASFDLGEAFAEADRSGLPPEWFMHVYRKEPLTRTECVRHLPIVPESVTESLISNTFLRKVIMYGLGYGVAFAVYSILRNTFLLAPWKFWESALLDTIVQPRERPSRNLWLRAGVFWLFVFAVMALVVWMHLGRWTDWAGSAWLWQYELTPWQTVIRFRNWLFSPLS